MSNSVQWGLIVLLLAFSAFCALQRFGIIHL